MRQYALLFCLTGILCAGQDAAENEENNNHNNGGGSTPAVKPADTYDPTKVNSLIGANTPRNYDWQPLTKEQRWKLYFNQTYANPGVFFRTAGAALGDQARNDPQPWGQGGDAYARRVANRFAIFTLNDSIEHGLGAAMGYEVRYVRSRSNNPLKRIGRAMMWDFVTYNREGKYVVNVPRLAGAWGSSLAAASWTPGYKISAQGVQNATQTLAIGGFFNILREFAPDLKRLFKK
jgi:hypothetical protein